ncbi:MAG: hypothetical protein ABDH28_06930 [Brevinematia bacterium]
MKWITTVLIAGFLITILVVTLLGYLAFFFDPNVAISQTVSSIENSYHLDLDYKLKEKNLLSALQGFEFENVEIFSTLKGKKQKLVSSKKVRVIFNLLSIFSSPEIRAIIIQNSLVDINNALKYVNSPEFKSNLMVPPTTNTPSRSIKIGFIRLNDFTTVYNSERFTFNEVNINLEKFRIDGYLTNTKSKFWFDGKNFHIDKFNGIGALSNITLTTIRGSFEDSKNMTMEIKTLNYSNWIKLESISIKGDIEKSLFNILVSNTLVSLNDTPVSITNTRIDVTIKDKIKGKFELIKKVKGEFDIHDSMLSVTANFEKLNEKDIPENVFAKLSNTVENLSFNGNIKLEILAGKINLFGNSSIKFSTKLKEKLLSNAEALLSLNRKEIDIKVLFKTSKSDLEIKGLITLGDNKPSLRILKASSKRIDISDITSNPITESKDSNQTLPSTLPVEITEVPLEVSIGEIISGNSLPKIQNILAYGNLNFGNSKLYASLDTVEAKVADVKFVAKGNIEHSDKTKVILNILPSNVDLGLLYPGLTAGKLGGRVYGRVTLKNLEVRLDDSFSVSGIATLNNVELIDISIQNEITKLLNLNLSHIFITEGNLEFRFETNSFSAIGSVNGDIISEFDTLYTLDKNKARVRFKYLKVDRSIVEDIPKIFFIRNEINGIRFRMDDKHLLFDKFDIELSL